MFNPLLVQYHTQIQFQYPRNLITCLKKYTNAEDIDDDLCILYKLSDLIRDLKLIKDYSELLASRLKEKNLLQKGVRISLYCKHSQNVVSLFQMKKMNYVIVVTLMVYFNSLNWNTILRNGICLLMSQKQVKSCIVTY